MEIGGGGEGGGGRRLGVGGMFHFLNESPLNVK